MSLRDTIIVLILAFFCISATKYVSSLTGNNADSGNDWPNAYLTIGYVINSTSEGDTIVLHSTEGTPFSEMNWVSPDFAKRYFIDSLRHTNGINWVESDSLYSAVIDGGNQPEAVLFHHTDDSATFVGIHFKGGAEYQIAIGYPAVSYAPAYVFFYQCYFSDHYDKYQDNIIIAENELDNVISSRIDIVGCLFNDSSRVAINFYGPSFYLLKSTDTLNIINNTFDGSWTSGNIYLTYQNHDAEVTVLNNIIYNDGADNRLIYVGDTTNIDNINYNVYYNPGEDTDGSWYVVGTEYHDFNNWKTRIQKSDPNGDNNSYESNPLLQGDYRIITENSPAYNVGSNIGYGNEIGYYQLDIYRKPIIIQY